MRRALLLAAVLVLPRAAAAQQVPGGDVLAEVLAAEDARRYDEPLLRRALLERDTTVRRVVLRSIGRLRDPRGLELLRGALAEPDTLSEAAAIFAVGLIGDTAGVELLARHFRDRPVLSVGGGQELFTALARIGDPAAAALVRSALEGNAGRELRGEWVERAALEAWRFGRAAPADALLPLLGDERETVRAAAAYALSRLRYKGAASRFLQGAQDKVALVRLATARVLTRSYADSAGLPPEQLTGLLGRLCGDADASVRVAALRALATYRNPATASRVLSLLEDPVLNVQVQAAQALGEIGGPAATEQLSRIVREGKGTWARRAEALLALARADSALFVSLVAPWGTSRDWRDRAVAARGWARVRVAAVRPFLEDADPKVVGAALEAWGDAVEGADSAYATVAGRYLTSRDAAVRSIAAAGVARGGNAADIPRLVEAYRLAARDSFPDAAIAALTGISTLLGANSAQAATLEPEAIAGLSRPADPVVARWAEVNWPALGAHWGPAWPLRTGRTLEEYRSLVRTLVLGTPEERYPTVRITLEQLGSIQLRLFGPDAPVTVAHFLTLVDRRYFDGLRFHRVVPAFVVQTGDPRGDGWGGPGTAIRDEINQRRYQANTVGMALSGPDTGGSQWFITLAAQPHLDGGYTIFGEVIDGVPALQRLTQGDLIRTIRR